MTEVTVRLDDDLVDDPDPVHGEFGLTYASYFVMPRVLLEAMPEGWQRVFVQSIRDFWQVFDDRQVDRAYQVHLRGEDGRFQPDPFSHYRHPNQALIDSVRVKR